MDLLGSIMNSMDKPPSLSEKERQLLKRTEQSENEANEGANYEPDPTPDPFEDFNQEKKEAIEQKQKEDKERLKRFKERVEGKLISHFDDSKNITLKFEPMDQIYRSIVHEAAESQNLLSFAFGTDGIDRYIRVYRKDHPPCEDEINARRRGEPWNEEIKKQLQKNKELQKLQDIESSKKPKKIIPNSNYKDKYAHLIGQDAALEAARKTESNKTYGFVPSENKRDHRSIEQTLADIKAKKRKIQEVGGPDGII